jgi:rod shape-determining protein MreD
MSFLSIMIHRRLLWFSVPLQAPRCCRCSWCASASCWRQMLGGGAFPGWSMFLAPVIESLLWPVVSVVLLVPQRRAPDPDANRPL